MSDVYTEVLRQKTAEHRTYLDSEICFGTAWTKAATHQQRLHRLDHVYRGSPWTYEDGPEGFSAEFPMGGGN